jgi:hypothetical protein
MTSIVNEFKFSAYVRLFKAELIETRRTKFQNLIQLNENIVDFKF